MLELAGYHHVTEDPEHEVLWPMLSHLLTSHLTPWRALPPPASVRR